MSLTENSKHEMQDFHFFYSQINNHKKTQNHKIKDLSAQV